MKMFLKQLWKTLKEFFQTKHISAEDSLPKALSEKEFVARFCFDRRDFNAETGNPKTKVFMPELYQDKHETSVCRKTNISEERIWEISKIVEKLRSKKVVGRADLGVCVVLSQHLTAEAAPTDYPEHSIIIGWPSGDEEVEKAKRKSIAQELAYKAKPVKIPS